MPIEPEEFTFEHSFSIIPLRRGSYMIEQGVHFSQAFSTLDEVVRFLIDQKVFFLKRIMHGGGGGSGDYDGGYAKYEHEEGNEYTGAGYKQLYPNDQEPFEKGKLKTAHQPGYEPFDKTGTPDYGKEGLAEEPE